MLDAGLCKEPGLSCRFCHAPVALRLRWQTVRMEVWLNRNQVRGPDAGDCIFFLEDLGPGQVSLPSCFESSVLGPS